MTESKKLEETHAEETISPEISPKKKPYFSEETNKVLLEGFIRGTNYVVRNLHEKCKSLNVMSRIFDTSTEEPEKDEKK